VGRLAGHAIVRDALGQGREEDQLVGQVPVHRRPGGQVRQQRLCDPPTRATAERTKVPLPACCAPSISTIARSDAADSRVQDEVAQRLLVVQAPDGLG
jgi:hypothetical protein